MRELKQLIFVGNSDLNKALGKIKANIVREDQDEKRIILEFTGGDRLRDFLAKHPKTGSAAEMILAIRKPGKQSYVVYKVGVGAAIDVTPSRKSRMKSVEIMYRIVEVVKDDLNMVNAVRKHPQPHKYNGNPQKTHDNGKRKKNDKSARKPQAVG